MKLHRVMAVIVRHCYEARRNVDRFMDMVYWPVLDIILWGFFTIYLSQGNRLHPDLVSFLLGAAILWGIFFAFQRDMTVGFLDELWARNMINLFSSPLSVWEYITGLICVNVVKVIVGFSCASAIAIVAYKFDIVPLLGAFLPYMLNLVLFAFAIGIIMAGLIVRYTTRIQTLAWSFAGSAAAGLVRVLSDQIAAARAPCYRMDTADDARLRRDAPGAGGRRILARPLLVGNRPQRELLRRGDPVFQLDLRLSPQQGPAGEDRVGGHGGEHTNSAAREP